MNRFDFFKEAYLEEINRREQINARISIPTGILTVIIGGEIYLFQNLPSISSMKSVIFYGLLFIFTITLVICFIYASKCYCKLGFHKPGGYQYSYIPDATSLNDYIKVLEQVYDDNITYYEAIGQEKEKFVNTTFEKYIIQNFIEGSTINRKSNYERTAALNVLAMWLIISLLLGALTFSLFFICKGDSSQPIDVRVVGSENVETTTSSILFIKNEYNK